MISFFGLILTVNIYLWILYLLLKPDPTTPTAIKDYPDFIKNFPDNKRKYDR